MTRVRKPSKSLEAGSQGMELKDGTQGHTGEGSSNKCSAKFKTESCLERNPLNMLPEAYISITHLMD